MSITSFRPTRRAVVRTAAWSVPVISIAAAAPAFAASGKKPTLTSASTPGKWGKDAQDLWHVSWDLLLTTGSEAISSTSITLTYIPTSGRSFDTFAISGYLPLDAGWTYSISPVTVPGQFSIVATNQNIAPDATDYIHVDFAGLQNNSAGTVSAVATVTYVNQSMAPDTATIPAQSWGSGSQHVHLTP